MNTAEPSIEDLSDATGISSGTIKDLLSVSADMISFDSPLKRSEDGDSTFGDFIEDESKGPEEQVIDGSLKRNVRSLLSVLSDKERNIIEMRYGFNGNKPMSLKEIGDSYNLTKERIRQIEKRALEKLKTAGESKDLETYTLAV